MIKMILETAQLLCTAIWISGKEAPYKKTHENHPCSIWARANKENWIWLRSLGLALCKEYTYRYGKVHITEKILKEMECPNIPDGMFFEPPQAMPDCYKNKKSSISAYKNFYLLGKSHLHILKCGKLAWKKREVPKFIQKIMNYI